MILGFLFTSQLDPKSLLEFLKSRFPTRVLKDVPHRVDDHDDP